ncbi:MAG: hypothetical protein ACXWT0_01640 [Methylobacter sp.]
MASNTENVKLGVCKVLYKGVDLGYTKGGVEVDVTTETHVTNIDQFGESTVNEFITKRNVKVTLPLAETTLDNMLLTMPGSTMKASGGVKATGTITASGVPAAGDTLVVGGVTFTFRSSAATVVSSTDILALAGSTTAVIAANIQAALAASTIAAVNAASYTLSGSVVTVTYNEYGTAGNAFTLVKTGTGTAVSGATLSGGVAAGKKRVDVTTGVSVGSLLAQGGKLILHPIALADTDNSEDFVIAKAATAGGLKFAYKHNEERVYNVEFNGYPDPVTGVLFQFGDAVAY